MAETKSAPSVAELADVLAEIVDCADWYRRCLEDVIDKRVVRGLAEARAGYDHAVDRATTALGLL